MPAGAHVTPYRLIRSVEGMCIPVAIVGIVQRPCARLAGDDASAAIYVLTSLQVTRRLILAGDS